MALYPLIKKGPSKSLKIPLENQRVTNPKSVIKKEYLYDMQKRAVIYARVSTLDKGQDPENQLIQLRDYAKRRGFHLVGEFVDHASGASEQREEYQKMINQVRKRKVDVVLVWRYDRFARSTQALARACWEVVLW